MSKCFEVYKSTYITYNNDNNIVVLGGCETPIEAIKLIKLSLDEKNKRKAARSRKRSVMIDIDDNYEKNEEISIDNFLDDDFQFWYLKDNFNLTLVLLPEFLRMKLEKC